MWSYGTGLLVGTIVLVVGIFIIYVCLSATCRDDEVKEIFAELMPGVLIVSIVLFVLWSLLSALVFVSTMPLF